MALWKLAKEIIARSDSKDWDSARAEWALIEVYDVDGPETCLCGHFPIHRICILQRRGTPREVTVGRCCVKLFIDPDVDKVTQACQALWENIDRAVSGSVVVWLHGRGMISDWEQDFYLSTWRKRILTAPQRAKRRQVNEKILGELRAVVRVG